MRILVLESSTTSAKAMLYDSEKGVSDIKIEAFLPQYSNVETQDAEGIFQQTAGLGRKILNGQPVDMVALSGTWHSVLACDRSMKPVTRSYTWAFTGSAPVAQRLRSNREFVRKFYSTTGCMVHATYPAFKMLLMKEQGLNLNDCFFMGQGTYNFYRLTGECLLSQSMASGSGLMNIHTKQFDSDILSFIEVSEDQFGKIVAYHDIRPLCGEGAGLLGLKSGIPVVTAHPDGSLNQVGASALGEGVMTFSVGTSAAIRISTSKPVLPEEPSTWCYLSPVSWLSGAATAGACNCVDWVKNKMFPASTSYKQIESADVDYENLPVFLPFLFGERCPGWQDENRATFFDLANSHSNIDLYFSTLEGVLFNIYQCFEVLSGINGMPAKIKLSGGILNSRLWTQMCSDIFQQEMECSKTEQMSLIGGAALAMELGGVLDDIQNLPADQGVIIHPNPEKEELYRRKYDRYKYWYNKMK